MITSSVPSPIPPMTPDELSRLEADPRAGLGCLRTTSGNLPLAGLAVDARITGLSCRVVLTQRFVNPHREPVEAVYVFPLPDRGAVTGMRMTADGHTVAARLREREQARAEYAAAVAAGQRASIAEEDRPDVFTMQVGNILPGEQVTVELTVVMVLPVADGEATFRFPLVVAPRYIPGEPLDGDAVGAGHAPDTDAVPDASRISPPVLLPGFPHPVPLDVTIGLDPAGLPMGTPRSSLHAVRAEGGVIRVEPGQRADRDVVLRIPLGAAGQPSAALTLVPDAGVPGPDAADPDPDSADGTFEVVVLPPDLAVTGRPRDVVLVLDRSGSMTGWKMVAARRAAARIVDTLGDHDRFAVLAFDSVVETPDDAPAVLLPGSDRNRFRAVEFLARLDARGGTELTEPLRVALDLLGEGGGSGGSGGRERVLVLVTDGQVGNEDQILRRHARGLAAVRVHTVGIDQAVNAGFLGRLAGWGHGRCELVESEDRLDEAMARIHERIGSPVVSGVVQEAAGVTMVEGTFGAGRLPDVFPGVPWVLRGRYRAAGDARVTVRGTTPDGQEWSVSAEGRVADAPSVTSAWARGQVRDLEDRYLSDPPDAEALEARIVRTSLRFGVLCRFTAYVAVDERVVTDGAAPRQMIQPVELPAGWAAPQAPVPLAMPLTASAASPTAWATGQQRPFVGMAAAPPPGSPIPRGFARRMSRGAGQAFAAASGEHPDAGHPDDAQLTRELLEQELGRLEQLAGEPAWRRRAALTDVGSWLPVTPRPDGVPTESWERLLAAVRPDRLASEPFDEVWVEAIEALRAVIHPVPGAPAAPPAGAKRHPAFWRHHPEI